MLNEYRTPPRMPKRLLRRQYGKPGLITNEMGIGDRRSGGVDYPRLARPYMERSSFNEDIGLFSPICAYTNATVLVYLNVRTSQPI